MGVSANARHVRWDQLMAENKGKIDVEAAQRFLADHYDTFDKKIEPERADLCGHIDLSPRGSKPWQPEYGPGRRGAKQGGQWLDGGPDVVHCGDGTFLRAELQSHATFAEHPGFEWEKNVLKDLDTHAWTTFRIAQ